MLTREFLEENTKPYGPDPKKSKLLLYQLENPQALGRKLTDQDIEQFVVPYLRAHPEIISVDLSGNNITAAGLAMIVAVETILELDVSDNRLGPEAGRILARNRSIISLDISENKLGDVGATALAENETIRRLAIGSNMLRGPGLTALAGNSTFTILSLANRWSEYDRPSEPAHNKFDLASAKALAANVTLEKLDVGVDEPNIDDEVMEVLEELDPIKRANFARDLERDARDLERANVEDQPHAQVEDQPQAREDEAQVEDEPQVEPEATTGVPRLQRLALFEVQKSARDPEKAKDLKKLPPGLQEELKKPRQ